MQIFLCFFSLLHTNQPIPTNSVISVRQRSYPPFALLPVLSTYLLTPCPPLFGHNGYIVFIYVFLHAKSDLLSRFLNGLNPMGYVPHSLRGTHSSIRTQTRARTRASGEEYGVCMFEHWTYECLNRLSVPSDQQLRCTSMYKSNCKGTTNF